MWRHHHCPVQNNTVLLLATNDTVKWRNNMTIFHTSSLSTQKTRWHALSSSYLFRETKRNWSCHLWFKMVTELPCLSVFFVCWTTKRLWSIPHILACNPITIKWTIGHVCIVLCCILCSENSTNIWYYCTKYFNPGLYIWCIVFNRVH